MKEKSIYADLKRVIRNNTNYTKIMDIVELEYIISFYRMKKDCRLKVIKELEKEKFLVQVSRGRAGIKFKVK